MKGPNLFLRTLGTSAATIILSLLAISFLPLLWGWTPVVITSGSMQPTLTRGSLVVIDSNKSATVGDVVTFEDPNREGSITHRVIAIDEDGLITKGDANAQPDPQPVGTEDIQGRVRVAVPLVGYPTVALQDGDVLPVVLVVAMLLAIVVLLAPRQNKKTFIPVAAIGCVLLIVITYVAVSTAKFSANTTNTANAFATKIGYPTYIRNEGPVAYFRLGEAPGSPTGVDEMGTTTLDYLGIPGLGFPGAIVGDDNTAMNITGAQRARTPSNVAALSFTGNVSVEAWFKPSASQTTNARVVSKYDGNNLNYLLAFDGSQKMRFLVDATGVTRVNSTATSSATLTDTNKWYHLVGTWDGVRSRIYVDGVSAQSAAATGNPAVLTTTQGLGIGAEYGGAIPVKGAVDDVSIWGRALSQAEVTQHRNAGLGL